MNEIPFADYTRIGLIGLVISLVLLTLAFFQIVRRKPVWYLGFLMMFSMLLMAYGYAYPFWELWKAGK